MNNNVAQNYIAQRRMANGFQEQGAPQGAFGDEYNAAREASRQGYQEQGPPGQGFMPPGHRLIPPGLPPSPEGGSPFMGRPNLPATAMPGTVNIRKPGGAGMPAPRPSGPISQPSVAEGGSQSNMGANGVGNQPDTSNGNPWMSPAALAGMDGSGGAKPQSKPGDGLFSFLNSGAPAAAFGQTANDGAMGPPVPSSFTAPPGAPAKGAFGEAGSPMSILSGGGIDPKSAMGMFGKIFGF